MAADHSKESRSREEAAHAPRDDVLVIDWLRSGREADLELVASWLLDKAVPKVRWVLKRHMNVPDHLIDGIVSDAMVKWWQSSPEFDPAKGTMRAWFFQIAMNAARDTFRSIRREREVIQDYAQERAASQRGAADQAGPGDGKLRALQEALAGLGEVERAGLLARANSNGAPWAEGLAKEFRTTPGAVRTRVTRALAKIVGQLGGPDRASGEAS